MAKLLSLLLMVFSLTSIAQTIPFQLTPDGHILVKARIQGQEGNFIFDTGGGINLFFDDFAQKLEQKSTYNFFTAFRATGERIDAPLFHSKEVVFGNRSFKNVPYTTYNMKVKGIDGLISLQMFQNVDLSIDYIKKQIILGPIDPNKHKKYIDIQLSTVADNTLDIFTYVLLNNQYRIKVMLDSGAGNDSFWLSDKLMDLLGLDKSTFELTEKRSEFNQNKVSKIYKGTIPSISNAISKVAHPKVNFMEGLIYEGKTSINWLGKKIGISLRTRKIYLLD